MPLKHPLLLNCAQGSLLAPDHLTIAPSEEAFLPLPLLLRLPGGAPG